MNAALKVFKDARDALYEAGFPMHKISDLLVSGWANFEIDQIEGEVLSKKLQKLGLRAEFENRYFWDEDLSEVQRPTMIVHL